MFVFTYIDHFDICFEFISIFTDIVHQFLQKLTPNQFEEISLNSLRDNI